MSSKRDGAAVVGVGLAACAACCAGPILGVLGAIGLGTLTGVLLFGTVGLLFAGAALVLIVARRRQRRRTAGCTAAPQVVAVDMPTIRG